MNSNEEEDNSYQNIKDKGKQGTTIIHVAQNEIQHYASPPKKSKRRGQGQTKNKRLPKISNEYRPYPQSQIAEQSSKDKENERGSQSKMRGADEETAGDFDDEGLPVPYEFLKLRDPSIFRIFFPRFTVKSITFVLTIIYIVMFIILLAYNYSKEQTDITWNCSLYRLQNKYFARLNINYELWRVVVSALFHSNIAHFFLNLFALSIYGYFVEWYYEKKKFLLTILIALVYGHFFAAIVQTTSVSTTSSSITMAIIALKIYFLWQYRQYKKLVDRRAFLYILLGLVIGINIIPLIVMNNVDYSAHLGGFIVGMLLGMFFHIQKIEEQTKCDKVLKWGSLVLLIATFILVIALTFAIKGQEYQYYSQHIETMCINNHA